MVSPGQFATNFLFTLFIFHSLAAGSYSTRKFTFVNQCSHTVWPGILPGIGSSPLNTTGFALQPDESNIITVPTSWSGHLWGRTLCSQDIIGKFFCLTGNCASSTVECDGRNATQPTTFAEFNLNGSSRVDFFRVSLVEGYNLPIMVEPQVKNDNGECMTMGCAEDLNAVCPIELKVMSGRNCVACRNVCQPFLCYSEFFKKKCPLANVDVTQTFHGVCASTDYPIIFCPTTSRSLMEPGKEKHPTTVDNSGGQNKWITLVYAIIAVVSISVIAIVIKLTISCSREGCNCSFFTEIRAPTNWKNVSGIIQMVVS